jgi:hypothetical protein
MGNNRDHIVNTLGAAATRDDRVGASSDRLLADAVRDACFDHGVWRVNE